MSEKTNKQTPKSAKALVKVFKLPLNPESIISQHYIQDPERIWARISSLDLAGVH